MRRLVSLLLVFAASRAAAQAGERACPAGAALRASVPESADAGSMPGMDMSASTVQVDSARREIRTRRPDSSAWLRAS